MMPTPDLRRNRLTPSETPGLVVTMADVRDHVGEHLGHTEWREMEQDRVDRFADVTEDHNFIHVDAERAQATPFGGTIAHGYLTLSLVAPILGRLLRVTDASLGVNYGRDRVRFPAPLPVGREWRGGVELIAVDDVPGGLQAKLRTTVEVRDSEKPAMVADCLIRLFA